jgi:transcriptional regulator with XRE-family HTH domain
MFELKDLANMDDIKIRVGARIKELRKKLTPQLSQEALALQANVDRTYMTEVENGRRNVSIEILEKITIALKISIAEFFQTSDFKTKPE